MKGLKYYGIILLSVVTLIMPIAGIGIVLYFHTKLMMIVGGAVAATGLMLTKPLQELRIKYRQDVEYDEFGRSKTKGDYSKLSKKERDAIDLQKTADLERILDSTAIKKMSKEGSEKPMDDMNALVGLAPVKQKMKEMVARMAFEQEDNKKKKKNSENTNSMSGRHMVFYGSPGTGKTTVARILTGFLYQYGYIKENKCIEVDGNFLKMGEYTAQKTQLIIRQAYGGVLFIDEAYALMTSTDGSGDTAIATLIKEMEDNRERFILILAGYTNEMKRLLDANPGFESRIKEYLDFPDYNDIEMREIFTIMARNHNFVIKDEAYDAFDVRISKERKLKSFGNGRTVRNILDETIDRHALNFMDKKIAPSDKYKICDIDICQNTKQTI